MLIVLVLLTNASASMSILKKQMKSVNIGKELGMNFETEVRNMLLGAGYQNTFNGNDIIVNEVLVHMGKKSSEFDAIVTGNKNSFGNFCDEFEKKYICSPPLGDSHLSIVEVKLNARLLIDWIKKEEGSKYLFFNEKSAVHFTKILVLNGGSDSEAFVNNLSSDEDIKEYADVKKIIREAKINVFYKLWASGESFADVVSKLNILQNENEEIKNENKEIKNENKEIKNENKEINSKYEELKNENKEINSKYDEVKKQLALISTKLKL